jgi:creatinine amidohydrolase
MPQIREAIAGNTIVLLPLGQTEQHGPHLQTGCDSIIAERVAMTAAETLRDDTPVLVLPTIPYGYVPKSVQIWPGVFRVGWETMVRYIADVCTSAVEMGFRKLIIISTHGPHDEIARLAARDVFDRTRVPVIVSIPHKIVASRFARIRVSPVGGCSHACEYETSLLLHFNYPVDLSGIDGRDRVQVCNEWVSGDMINGSGRISWSTWGLQVSETGVYGDPSVASRDTGRATFDAIIEEYCSLIRFLYRQKIPTQGFPTTQGTW